MQDRPPQRVTQLLQLPEKERGQHEEELLGLVYRDLRSIAAGVFQAERQEHTLQPTAVVHEAWLRLGLDHLQVEGRKHFYGVVARAMRQVLVDHARKRAALKRVHPDRRVTLSVQWEEGATSQPRELEVLGLDSALTELAERYPRQAKVAELRFLVGLDVLEVGRMLGISEKSVRRDWRFARSWLQRSLADEAPPH